MTGTRVASFGPTGARAAALALLAVALSACYVPRETTETIPNDYRLRHPIAIQEGSRKMVVLIGTRRGTLTPTQRAEVMNFARTWRHEATGGVLVEVPADTPNHKAASEALQEVRALLAAAEVPPRAVRVVSYQAGDAGTLAPIKLAYPKIVADAGPCGLWPHDLGPGTDPLYLENRPYWNLGCASQRNFAAMVAEPADLVQPRGETPAYTARRTQVLDKYRKGESPATTYANPNLGKISDVGQ